MWLNPTHKHLGIDHLSNDFDETVLDVAEIMRHVTYPKRVVRPRQVPAPEDESF